MEFFVISIDLQKCVVCASRNDSSLMEYADLVGILHRGESVGDGDSGARLHQPFQGILHKPFALGVEGRCCLVENQNGRILQYGPRYADALALAARESSATVADACVESLLRSLNEIVGIGNLGRKDHILP